MAPWPVRRGELVDVRLVVTDSSGVPHDDEVKIDVLGEYGPILVSGHYAEASRSGAFPTKLIRGNRYRFSLGRRAGQATASVDHVVDGTLIRIVAPPQ